MKRSFVTLPPAGPSAPLLTLTLILMFSLAGCGRHDDGETTADASGFPGMEADLARTLEEQSDFYVFKTPADFEKDTQGLKWEDGSDLPEFADPNAKKGGTLRIWIQDFPRTLRVVGPDATGGIRQFLLDYTEPWIVQSHPNIPGAYYPGLASSWAVSRETKTVYFQLDPDARWSDGVPITTDDVVFSFYFMRTPLLNDPWYNDYYTKNYKRVTIYDKQRFAITMPMAPPDIIYRAVGDWSLFPRHAFADFGPDWIQKFQWRVMPTSGPYVLREDGIDKGNSITFTRLDDWWAQDKKFWRGRFNPDRLRLIVIRDINKAFESFRRGDLDLFGMTTPIFWYDKLPNSDPLVQNGYINKATFYNRIPRPDWGLWINESKPPLNNRDVRLGIQYATNFQLVCDQYYRGDAVVQRTRNDGFGIPMNPAIEPRPFDPARARQYFAQAGFTQPGPDGVLMNDAGQRLSFRVTTYEFPGASEILSILKQEALKAGLELNLEVLDQTTGWKKVQEKNHQIALIALSRSPELYPRYWEMYHGSNAYADAYLDENGKPVDKYSAGRPNPSPKKVRVQTNNMTMTFIPELDRLIEQYDQSEDLEEIKTLSAQMEQIIYDDASWVNGWAIPFFRIGYWRWVEWPKDFNAMKARDPYELFLFSIDTAAEKETRDAMRSGQTFPPQILTFDQYKEQ